MLNTSRMERASSVALRGLSAPGADCCAAILPPPKSRQMPDAPLSLLFLPLSPPIFAATRSALSAPTLHHWTSWVTWAALYVFRKGPGQRANGFGAYRVNIIFSLKFRLWTTSMTCPKVIGIIVSSVVRLSVCNAVHCGSQGLCSVNYL